MAPVNAIGWLPILHLTGSHLCNRVDPAFATGWFPFYAILQKALNGEVVAQVLDQQRTFNVYMRFDDKSRANLDLIKQTVLKIMPDGRKVTLEKVADVFESQGPNQINRENAQRRIVVSANSSGRDLDSLVTEVQSRIQKQVQIPDGYFVQYRGQFESQKSASRLILFLGILSGSVPKVVEIKKGVLHNDLTQNLNH